MGDLTLEDQNEAERKTELIATNADLGPNQLKRFADSVVLLIRPTSPSNGNFHALRGVAGGTGSGLVGEAMSGNGVRGTSQSNAGVVGRSTSSVGVWGDVQNGAGVLGESQNNIGVSGRAKAMGYGVLGRSDGNTGVVGRSVASVGVWGDAQVAAGVLGESRRGVGVFGVSTENAGVAGQSEASIGVWGSATRDAGVFGESREGIGVVGRSDGSAGVWGVARQDAGVQGESENHIGVIGVGHTEGYGMLGESNRNAGVVGRSERSVGVWGDVVNDIAVLGTSTKGHGVAGFSDSAPGVFGQSQNDAGVSGFSPSGAGVFGDSVGDAGVFGRSLAGAGVLGQSNTHDGVAGRSASGAGVSGDSLQGIGVIGRSQQEIGVAGEGKTVGIFGAVSDPSGVAGLFKGRVVISGDLNVTGAKGAVVPHPDGSQRLLCAIESPESWFEDFGEARLDGGRTEIQLDPDFAQLTSSDRYHVFLTPYGESNGLYVESRSPRSFVVREQQGGTSAVPFSYRLVARRRDVDVPRFKKIEQPDVLRKEEPIEGGGDVELHPHREEIVRPAHATEKVLPPKTSRQPVTTSRGGISIQKPDVEERLKKRQSD